MSEQSTQAQAYQTLVLRYEQLCQDIQAFLAKHGGHTENMSRADMLQYRQLAEERDSVYDQMKTIEANWLEE